jgi:uncharacterized membrane protein YesL
MPIVTIIFYFLSYAVLIAWDSNSEKPQLVAFLIGFLPFFYVATIVFWLPIVIYFERARSRTLKHYLIAGGALGLLFSLASYAIHGAPELNVFTAISILVAILMGCIVSSIFWLVAFYPNKQV